MAASLTKRRPYLDMLRIMACFLVCFNHSDGFHIFLYQEADGSLLSWFHVILSVFTASIDIPMFFMLSGGLLLGREESYQTLFRKRIARFAVLLIAASLVIYTVSHPGGFSLPDFIRELLRGEINLSYWFLYAYLAFLFALPFLRKIAKHLTGQDVLFLTLCRFILVSLALILDYWLRYFGMEGFGITAYFSAPFSLVDFLFYPLVGYYLVNLLPMEKVGRREVGICFAVLLGGCAVSSVMTYHQGLTAGFSQTYVGLFNYSSAMAVLILVRSLMERVSLPQKVSAVLARASSMIIGIYLTEPLVGHFLYRRYFASAYLMQPVIRLGYSVLWCLICMSIGGTLTFILRKIPGVKKFL